MTPMFRRLIAVLLSLAAFAAMAAETKRNISVAVAGEKRVALVIGNGKYPGTPLKNPANDARDMAAALRKIGFDVIERTDVTQKEMNRAIAQFGNKLTAETVALFFYAGHGMQVRGKNYIIPIDAQIETENAVRAEAVDVDTVLDQLSASPLNVVILDACRNNPFERRFRSVGGGLAQMEAPKGTLIAYATAPGKVASDGDGRNGIYTQELLKIIATPHLPVEQAFKRVRANVARATGDNQVPWESSSLTGDFYFSRTASTAPPAGSPIPLNGVAERTDPAVIELAFWDSIKNSTAPSDFQAYLDKYPEGHFSELAKTRRQQGKLEIASAPGIGTASPTRPLDESATGVKPRVEVVFFRESGFLGMNTGLPVRLNDQAMGTLTPGSYISRLLEPGAYQLSAFWGEGGPYPGVCANEIVRVESSGKLFFKMILGWGGRCSIERVESANGESAISGMEKLVPKDGRKVGW